MTNPESQNQLPTEIGSYMTEEQSANVLDEIEQRVIEQEEQEDGNS